MKRGLPIFWMLYMFFFAVPFPMILYYLINSEYDNSGLKDRNPWLALSILLLSVVLWLILLIGYFRKWVLRVFLANRSINELKQKGTTREARILAVKTSTKLNAAYPTYELLLSLKNLVGAEITQKIEVNDARPFERRFEVGKRVGLFIDPDLKHNPPFVVASAEVKINKKILALFTVGWLILVAVVISYYSYTYQSESSGMGWRFLSFWHPLIICPLVLLFYRGIARWIHNKLSGNLDHQATLIKFNGLRTVARLISAHQTGTFINEQPMVRFELEFVDQQQKRHKVSLKKIVSLLDLNVTRQEMIEIFYLKAQPEKIAFASDLDDIS